ncbi:MAG: redox-regulated ATPase YchF [Candidatus Latescibacteria bacterium]|nr:redox-regulated ATPase YchF [Candidatus Latescibacterota bacterium]
MKLGLAGFPQVGKRTLFKLLTGLSGDNKVGTGPVRDPRFDHLTGLYGPAKETPAVVEFVLLPDLDLEAERNAQALASLDDVDAICHLVRCFADDSVFHLAGSVDPERDIRLFAEELQLTDMVFIEKRLDRMTREQKGKKPDARASLEAALLPRMQAHLEEGQPLSAFVFSEEEVKLVASYPLLSRKTLINVLNVDEDRAADESQLQQLAQVFQSGGFAWITVSARIEEELAQLEDEERQAFLDDLGLEQPALDRLSQLCYAALGLMSFFTVGEDEVRAWTIRQGSLAPQAGRAIHTDIERGFIRAEVMKFTDLVELGDEAQVKTAGRLQVKGRDYPVEDGDIIHFLHKA